MTTNNKIKLKYIPMYIMPRTKKFMVSLLLCLSNSQSTFISKSLCNMQFVMHIFTILMHINKTVGKSEANRKLKTEKIS